MLLAFFLAFLEEFELELLDEFELEFLDEFELELLEEFELELLDELELELLEEFELELPAEAGGVPKAASAARRAFSEGPAKGASVAAPAAMSPQTPTAV